MREPTVKQKAKRYDQFVLRVARFHKLRNGVGRSESGLKALEELARELATFINEVLLEQQYDPDYQRVAFMLYCTHFKEEEGEPPWATYVCNTNREQMAEAVLELLTKLRSPGKGLH